MATLPDGAFAVQHPVFAALKEGECRLTVLTGAGISTECGVPDFRSPGSPWRIHQPIGFADFVSDPALRAEAWRRKFAMDDIYKDARPGRSHVALVRLSDRGILRSVITQNIDGLHQAAGLDADRLVELHGNGTYARCLSCGLRVELPTVRVHFEATGEAPLCPCGGLVKSATIAFGQPLDPDTMAKAVAAVSDCDILLAIGSSLVVRPASRLPLIARDRGATLVIVNREPTPLDDDADHVIRADAGAFLTALAGGLALEPHLSAFRGAVGHNP